MTLYIMTLKIKTFSITTYIIMTFSITTLSIMRLIATLCIASQHKRHSTTFLIIESVMVIVTFFKILIVLL
jgi:hypothetical protein